MIHLFIIDPQNDFIEPCPSTLDTRDLEAIRERTHFSPMLPVSGSFKDMERIQALIMLLGSNISEITISLDSHNLYDIAHPAFWKLKGSQPVPAFTQVTLKDVLDGNITPVKESCKDFCEQYLEALLEEDKTHMIWPAHCVMGTWGHNLHYLIRRALNTWEVQTGEVPKYVLKGQNPLTEHFSAFKAILPVHEDLSTSYNHELLQHLTKDMSSILAIAGEASSHCVKGTVEHLVRGANCVDFPLEHIVILTDCMSPVAGFEHEHEEFFKFARENGLKLMTSLQFQEMILC